MPQVVNLYDGIKKEWQFADVDGLQHYLNDVWQNRPLFLQEEDDEEEIRSTTQKFFNVTASAIQPRNYVGFVQYGDLRINIYPRVFYRHPVINIEDDPHIAINNVLLWLSYARRIHFPFSEVPLQPQAQDDWLEALIFLFADYTGNALTTSPHFAYEEVTEEMAFVRGRIAMQPYINHNLATGRHQLLHCTYQPFVYDNLFNRVVKYTCRLLQSFTINEANRNLLDEILFLLDDVSDVVCTAEDCARVPVNRLYPEVGTITDMCAAFLNNQVYSGGLHNNNLCILLPMEVIFEQYVAGFIQKHFPELKARQQASEEYLALTGEDFKQRVFQMKHDILVPDRMIVDTKYKFRYHESKESDRRKGGVSQSDVYQMVTYCYKRKINTGLLLYPKHFDDNSFNEVVQFQIKSESGEMMIAACSFDITENGMNVFDERQRQKFDDLLESLGKIHPPSTTG